MAKNLHLPLAPKQIDELRPECQVLHKVPNDSIQSAADVESFLKNERKNFDAFLKEPKLLLLGASDSGKSTLLKQLKIMHGGGFSDQEREKAKKRIITGMFQSILALLGLIDDFDFRDVPEKYRLLHEAKDDYQKNNSVEFSMDVVVKMKEAWKEKIIQDIWENRDHMIPDSFS